MGAPAPPQAPTAPPPAPDLFAAKVAGLRKAETDRRLRASTGRDMAFGFDDASPAVQSPFLQRRDGIVRELGR